jgi:predicted RND superfamily exporter protein
MTAAVARITRTALRFSRSILVIWLLLLTAAATAYVSQFSIDNSVGIWFLEDDPDLSRYRDFTRTFGDREWTIAVVRGASIRAPRFRSDLAAATREIAALPDVERSLSIAYPGPTGTALQGLLVRTGDDRHTAVLIETRDQTGAASVSWMRTVDGIRAILERGENFEAFWLAGTPVINAELNRAARRDMAVFYSVIASLLVVFSLVFLGNWRDTIVISSVVAGSILPPLAAVGASGAAFNMITLMLPTILVAMSSSLAIHAITEFHLSARERPVEVAIEEAIAAFAQPAFWSSATTSLGFLALAQSQVVPIRQVGYLAALGIWSGFLTAMLIAPVLLGLLWQDPRLRRSDRRRSRAVACIDGLLKFRVRPRLTIACAAALFGACMAGLPYLKADTDYVNFFREGRQLNRDYGAIAAAGFPQDVFSLDLKLPRSPIRDTIARLAARIGSLPAVDMVLPVAAAEEPLRTQLVFFTEHLSSNAIGDLEARVSGIVESIVPAGTDSSLVGTRILWSNMDQSVIETQLRSVFLVFGLLLVLMPLLTGSIRVGLTGLVVSALPVFSVLGLMGWAGLTVNIATCLIGGVALGVAIDDTIFFLARVRREREAGAEIGTAIAVSRGTVGRAMVMTTSIMTLCFLTMGLSDFLPTVQFGLLFSVVLVLALLADLIVLPGLLLWTCGRWGLPVRGTGFRMTAREADRPGTPPKLQRGKAVSRDVDDSV